MTPKALLIVAAIFFVLPGFNFIAFILAGAALGWWGNGQLNELPAAKRRKELY